MEYNDPPDELAELYRISASLIERPGGLPIEYGRQRGPRLRPTSPTEVAYQPG